jgi:hypothetical protein
MEPVDNIHNVLCQVVEINTNAVLAFQQKEFNAAAIAFREALASIRALATCSKWSMALASTSPYSTSSVWTETAPIASIDEMMVTFLSGNVAFYGYAFHLHLKPFDRTGVHVVTEKNVTITDVVAAFTSTIAFNLALTLHRMGWSEVENGVLSGRRHLNQAASLYSIFQQSRDDASLTLFLPLSSVTVELAALNNGALVQQQLHHRDAFDRCLAQFKATYTMWGIGTRNDGCDNQTWHIFMFTLLVIQWSYKEAAAAA